MNIARFIEELEKLGIIPSKENLEALKIYKELLIDYNKKFNLTAITKETEIYLKHFYDSLTLIKVIDLDKELKVMDIGTGAGFPGLVLKIIFPKLEIVLLDSNHKKINFLNEVIKELDLKNIKCLHGRVENLPEEYREHFDIVVSRAVASFRVLLEIGLPYVKTGGKFIAMKGNKSEEIEEATNTLKYLNSNIEQIEQFTLPDDISKRAIISVRKNLSTSKTYPRKYDQVVKRPL